ncbi:MAG: proline dehydrogenase family protein [Nitrospinae bacterium]|nr:proline dehydrogenase family protein [Nitrospinota bacterium]
MNIFLFLARRFIAGETFEQAKEAVKRLNDRGFLVTIDILGESVTNKEQAEKARDSYIELLKNINTLGLNSNVSLKLTQMGLDIDDSYCYENVVKVVKTAIEHKNFVRIDMEGSRYTQKTIDTFKKVLRVYPQNIGMVIQSYLYRSKEDIICAIENRHRIRLCKGAYKEPPDIAFPDKRDVNKNYEEMAKKLLLKGNYPAIATHDERLINIAKSYAKENNISKDRFEFQMLYGIRRDLQERLITEGYRVRIYVPYGTYWMPYTIRRIRERKENLWFVLRNIFRR